MKEVVFWKPGATFVALMGVLLMTAAGIGFMGIIVSGLIFDPKTFFLSSLGMAGIIALGFAFVNTWRTPMLVVSPDALTIPTVFGQRDIPITPDHPIGTFLTIPDFGTTRNTVTIEGRKSEHFYTLDERGKLVLLTALHRASPDIAEIRRALEGVGGLTLETLKRDPSSRINRPDISHWPRR